MTGLRGPMIAFSGSRNFTNTALIEKLMRRLAKRWPRMIVRVGDASTGVDRMVGHEATRWGIWPDVQVCHWPPQGSTRQERWAAAHERNGRVIRDADLVIAIYAPGPKSPGTTDCVKQALAAGLPIWVYHEGSWSALNGAAEGPLSMRGSDV